MTDAENLFHSISQLKSSSRTLVLFHGTGADENDLIPLAESLDSETSILSVRGNVQEHGLNRFFVRQADGTFDQESIESEARKLRVFLETWTQENNRTFEDLVFLGYSNGANFALSFIFLYPELVKKAILLHPTLPFVPPVPLDLKSTKLLVTSGKHDPYVPMEKLTALETVLEQSGAHVGRVLHEGGHEIQPQEREAASEFLRSA